MHQSCQDTPYLRALCFRAQLRDQDLHNSWQIRRQSLSRSAPHQTISKEVLQLCRKIEQIHPLYALHYFHQAYSLFQSPNAAPLSQLRRYATWAYLTLLSHQAVVQYVAQTPAVAKHILILLTAVCRSRANKFIVEIVMRVGKQELANVISQDIIDFVGGMEFTNAQFIQRIVEGVSGEQLMIMVNCEGFYQKCWQMEMDNACSNVLCKLKQQGYEEVAEKCREYYN